MCILFFIYVFLLFQISFTCLALYIFLFYLLYLPQIYNILQQILNKTLDKDVEMLYNKSMVKNWTGQKPVIKNRI